MNCMNCGSTQFEEENGLFFCRYCQTQSQGFAQQSEQDYIPTLHSSKIKEKKRVKRITDKKTGVLWTTTEAFNLILFKQLNDIFEFSSKIIDKKEMFDMTRLVWISYLRNSGLTFTDNESEDKLVSRRLHPASRFRDVQILTNKVDKFLLPYKNGSKEKGISQCIALGNEGVIRTFEDSESVQKYELQNRDTNDIFERQYGDPRKYAKIASNGMKIPKESRKELRDYLSKMSVDEEMTENFDNFDEELQKETEETLQIEDSVDKDMTDLPQNDDSMIDSTGVELDYDKELVKNMSKTSKLYSKYIPLSHMKKSQNINSNYFIDLMSLPKTLSILNIVNRLLSYDIYCFDLIRWANEGHIIYNNCVTCFPEDWVLISNDCRTFTSLYVPSYKTLSILSAKIANHIKIRSFPRPNLDSLLIRFAKDLNLPKEIVNIINDFFNLYDNFPKELGKMSRKHWPSQAMPSYEIWALMTIIIVLKRIFILNDKTEKILSHFAENAKNLFIWDEWESYTRLRLSLIRSYYIPSFPGDLEDICDATLIADHYLTEIDTSFGENKNAQNKCQTFRTEAQREFKDLTLDYEPIDRTKSHLKPSFYPLTNATDFSLNQINCLSIKEKLSISFENKLMSDWMCRHGLAFHRGYEFLSSDQQKWSQSFKLLIYLSSFILNTNTQTLIPILKKIEKKFFK